MPRPGPRRPSVGVRLSPEEIAALDELARRAGAATRSDYLRGVIQRHLRRRAAGRHGPDDARPRRAADEGDHDD